jgi:hypothetical protein
MRVLSVIMLGLMLGGCQITEYQIKDGADRPNQHERAEEDLILDAVLTDVLTNPILERTRHFYGRRGRKRLRW